jgi:putative endonuclease
MSEVGYFTYIVSSRSRTLYVGVTSDLKQRIFQHKEMTYPGFTALYNCNRLVWFEQFSELSAANQREEELKGWIRARKVALIEGGNPTWEDLSSTWYPALVEKRVLRNAYPSARLPRR